MNSDIKTVYKGGERFIEINGDSGFDIDIPNNPEDGFTIYEVEDGERHNSIVVMPQEISDLIDGLLTAKGKYREIFGIQDWELI